MVCDYCGTTGHGTSSTRPLFDDEFVYCLLYCHLSQIFVCALRGRRRRRRGRARDVISMCSYYASTIDFDGRRSRGASASFDAIDD